MTHRCPAPHCAHDVPDSMLACSGHWYQVPPVLRAAVWRAWNDGQGAGSAEHTAAITAAIGRMSPFKKDMSGE